MKILYMEPRLRKGKMYAYYRCLSDALGVLGLCYVYKREVSNIQYVLRECPFVPDAVVFGFGYLKAERFGYVRGLRELGVPVIVCVFKPQNELERKLAFCRSNHIDMLLSPIPAFKEYGEQAGCRARLFRYGCCPSVFRDRGRPKTIDFGFSGALHDARHYIGGAFVKDNMRSRIHALAKADKTLKCFLNGSDFVGSRISNADQYAEKIGRSKIWLATPGPFGDMPPRYLEIGMCRTLIFTSKVPEVYRDMFVDGHNCVQFSNSLRDFRGKLHYYVDHADERQRITDNAYREFHAKHTWIHRARELISIIKGLQNEPAIL